MTAMVVGQSGAEEDQGAVGPAICAAGALAAEMACGVDPGTSILEGSNVLANWATDIGNAVGGGSGGTAGEAKDILGTITGGRDSGGGVASARGGRQWQLPLPSLQASLARNAMTRLLLSLLSPLLVGVSKLILTSRKVLVLVLP
jgi:hypothetical protein